MRASHDEILPVVFQVWKNQPWAWEKAVSCSDTYTRSNAMRPSGVRDESAMGSAADHSPTITGRRLLSAAAKALRLSRTSSRASARVCAWELSR